jgi:hypothetical protein
MALLAAEEDAHAPSPVLLVPGMQYLECGNIV